MRLNSGGLLALVGVAGRLTAAAPAPTESSPLDAFKKIDPEQVFKAFDAAGFRDKECTLDNVVVRREWRTLSKEDRKDYIRAVQCLMKKPPTTPTALAGVRSRFDDYQAVHINQTTHIHSTADFLSWHRWYTWQYEKDLRELCGYKGWHPYWDWTLETELAKSPVLDGSETSMGNNGEYDPNQPDMVTLTPTTGDPPFSFPRGTGGGCLKSGPFHGLQIPMGPRFNLTYNPRCLKRDFNQWGLENWCNKTNLADLFKYDDIGNFQFIMQGDLAHQQLGVHGGGHRMTGGDMGDVFASPGDPVFYLHHAMVDRVWWLWQLADPKKRTLQLNGTSTLANNPPSPPMKLTDLIDLGYVSPGEKRSLGSLMSTLAGGFCYIYL